MRRTRRYADWRPVATRRMPARLVGALVGAFVFVIGSILLRKPSYPIMMGTTALAAFVSNRVAARRLDALRDEEEDRQFAATLQLKRATAYGHDEGLVSFEDGYLIYMGRRCAFSLGGRDVHVTQTDLTALKFEFRGPGGKHAAHLQLRRNDDFHKAVIAWRSARKSSPESVLPPSLPDPALPRALTVFMNALPLLVLSATFLAIPSKDQIDRLLLPAIPILLLTIALSFAFVQTLELDRLARGEPRVRSPLSRLRRARRRKVAAKKHQVPATLPTLPAQETADAPTAEVRTRG